VAATPFAEQTLVTAQCASPGYTFAAGTATPSGCAPGYIQTAGEADATATCR
jgi:hypothetical protein